MWSLPSKNRLFPVLLLIGAAFLSRESVAHPLGNNSINRQAWIHVVSDKIELRYRVEMAEIPTLAETQTADSNQDGDTSPPEWDAYAKGWAQRMQPQLQLQIDRVILPLTLVDQKWTTRIGAAALNTLLLEAQFSVPLSGIRNTPGLKDQTGYKLAYQDSNSPGQFGWKEIWIDTDEGASIIRSTAAQSDRSRGLSDYTLPAGSKPPSELVASAELSFAGSATTPSSRVTEQAPVRSGSASRTAPAISVADGSAAMPAGAPAHNWFAQRVWPFFRLGVYHIATGLDHLVFLLGLLLLSQSFGKVVKVITAFTIAHSLTLALAANGWVTPPGALIEPAIALTISYVGLLSLFWRNSRHSGWLAFGFGLIHGFGFAGGLAQTLSQQPASHGSWLVSLASFNLGIEGFQILLVCLTVPLLRYAARFSWFGLARQVASASVLLAGLSWFFSRTLSLI